VSKLVSYEYLHQILVKASVASTAPRNDLHMLQLLHLYPDRDVSEAKSWNLSRQLWYLSEDLILLSLFNAEVPLVTKCEILKAAREKDSEKDPPKRVLVVHEKQKTLITLIPNPAKIRSQFWDCLSVSLLLILFCGPAQMTSWLQRRSYTLFAIS